MLGNTSAEDDRSTSFCANKSPVAETLHRLPYLQTTIHPAHNQHVTCFVHSMKPEALPWEAASVKPHCSLPNPYSSHFHRLPEMERMHTLPKQKYHSRAVTPSDSTSHSWEVLTHGTCGRWRMPTVQYKTACDANRPHLTTVHNLAGAAKRTDARFEVIAGPRWPITISTGHSQLLLIWDSLPRLRSSTRKPPTSIIRKDENTMLAKPGRPPLHGLRCPVSPAPAVPTTAPRSGAAGVSDHGSPGSSPGAQDARQA